MSLTIHWFWVIKLIIFIWLMFLIGKNIKENFKSKFWLILMIISFILSIINPIKIDLNTRAQVLRTNQFIQSQKVLPDKIEDDTFKIKSHNVYGITEEDLN